MQSGLNSSIEIEGKVVILDMEDFKAAEGPKSSLLANEIAEISSYEEITTSPSGMLDLKLQIPPRSFDISEFKAKVASTTSPSSSKRTKTPTSKGVQSRLSFRYRVSSSQSVKKGMPDAAMLKSKSQHGLESLTSVSSPYSLSGILRTMSGTLGSSMKPSSKRKIRRSLSVPANKIGTLKRTGSTSGIIFLVKSITPCIPDEMSKVHNDLLKTDTSCEGENEDGEKIAEEEAICRICFDDLCVGGPTLKMECSCKGELALAHEECACKWFSIKGDHACDICGEEVKNLPVTIKKLSNENSDVRQQLPRGREHYRIWQDISILVMISVFGYFCLLEQLLVSSMGSSALAISLPFAGVLGLLASLTASTLVEKKYLWAYASLQFCLVILFSHIFYSVLHFQPILTILLASLAGVGVAMSVNALIHECVSWNREQAQRYSGTQTSLPEAM